MTTTDPTAILRGRVRGSAKILDLFRTGWAARIVDLVPGIVRADYDAVAYTHDPFIVGVVSGEFACHYDRLIPRPSTWAADVMRDLGLEGDTITEEDYPRLAGPWREEILARVPHMK